MLKIPRDLIIRSQIFLLVLLILEAELPDHDLDVGLGGSLQQLLQPHQASVVLVEDREALPAETLDEIGERLEVRNDNSVSLRNECL